MKNPCKSRLEIDIKKLQALNDNSNDYDDYDEDDTLHQVKDK